MTKNISASKLSELFESLDEGRKAGLFEYAEYLLSKSGPLIKVIGEPLDITRPESETVVGAIKRLKKTYSMIESRKVFSEASALMTEHMVNGRDLMEVIDELQILFEESYQELIKDQG